MDYQTRFAPMTETKAREGVVEGYGSVFGVVDSYGTTIEPGAFTRSLAEWSKRGEMPGMFLQHDGSMPFGVWETMSEDAKGLKVQGRLASSSLGEHVAKLFDMNAVRGLSIGFMPRKWREDGKVMRFEDVDLVEVSMVTRPANAKAKAQLRADMTIRDFEALLRESGFTARQAKAIAAEGFKPIGDDRDDPPNAGTEHRDGADSAIRTTLFHDIMAWTNSLKGSAQ